MDKGLYQNRFDRLCDESAGYWRDMLSLADAQFERDYPRATAIERMMLLGFHIMATAYDSVVIVPPSSTPAAEAYLIERAAHVPAVFFQMRIPDTRYTVDFLVGRWRGPKTVVECDGHDFHERTPEQAEHDRRRERELVAGGFSVFRFTGREIWRDPVRCASDVINHVEQATARAA